MSSTRLAARYAKPLLELAEKGGVLEEVFNDMANFVSLCKANREFVLMLKSPIVPHLKKADILNKIFATKVNKLTLTAFELIARKNREAVLPNIAEEFVVLYNAKKGFQEATLSTPIELDNEMRSAFNKMIKDISGKEPRVKEVVNPDLIGGYVLRMGDKQLDESISGQLKELELKFKKETI